MKNYKKVFTVTIFVVVLAIIISYSIGFLNTRRAIAQSTTTSLKYAVIYISESDDTYNSNWRNIKESFDKVSAGLTSLSGGKYDVKFDLLGEKRINNFCWNPAAFFSFDSMYIPFPGTQFDGQNSTSFCTTGNISSVAACPHCKITEPGVLGCTVGRTVSIENTCSNKIPNFSYDDGGFSNMKQTLLSQLSNNPGQYTDTVIVFGRLGPAVFDSHYAEYECTGVHSTTLGWSNFALSEYALQPVSPVIDCSRFNPPEAAVKYNDIGWKVILHEILHNFGAVDVYHTGMAVGVNSDYQEALAIDPRVNESIMGDRREPCMDLSRSGIVCTESQLDQVYLDKYNRAKMGWNQPTPPPTPVPAITVTSPNGGEKWAIGSKQNITWTSGSSTKSTSVKNVRIELFKSGVFVKTIVSPTANDGLFSWKIPANTIIGSGYSVKIKDTKNDSTFDTSNSNFTIVAKGSLTASVYNAIIEFFSFLGIKR